MDKSANAHDDERIEALRQTNIGRLFLYAHRAYSARANVKLRERGYEGLTQAHSILLANLDLKGTRLTTLARRAGITKQSMGQLAVELEQQGYIERLPDPTDKRATLVKFTEVGKLFFADNFSLKDEIDAEYQAILGKEGFDTLVRLLMQLLDGLNASERDVEPTQE